LGFAPNLHFCAINERPSLTVNPSETAQERQIAVWALGLKSAANTQKLPIAKNKERRGFFITPALCSLMSNDRSLLPKRDAQPAALGVFTKCTAECVLQLNSLPENEQKWRGKKGFHVRGLVDFRRRDDSNLIFSALDGCLSCIKPHLASNWQGSDGWAIYLISYCCNIA